jgi:hypothetical protein
MFVKARVRLPFSGRREQSNRQIMGMLWRPWPVEAWPVEAGEANQDRSNQVNRFVAYKSHIIGE